MTLAKDDPDEGQGHGEEDAGEIPGSSELRGRFRTMMEALFREGGDSLRIEILERPEVAGFIESHAAVLDGAFERTEMSGRMRDRLRESDWMFSGLKTFHELREAFPSLLDEKGEKKPFERFLRDVRSIDATYNRNWLRSEYNFAGAAAGMAARWESFEKDGGDYYLQYRTARDGHVRPDHAAMDGITLPADDPFWDTNFPPNGWNCRCTVVQVLRDDNTPTDRDEAYRRAEEALRGDRRGMFRFNPGKEGRVFPAHNPYTTSRCSRCGKSKLNLTREAVPDNELCQACQFLQSCYVRRSTSYKVGEGTVSINEMVNRNDSDFDTLRQTAEEFAKMGRNVTLTPRMTRPTKFRYECVYGSIPEKYNGKCPDLNIDGLWYEHEGFVSKNSMNAFRNMMNNGLKQSSRLIIDDPGLDEEYMERRLSNWQGATVEEVWLRKEDGSIKLLYKKSEE